MSHASISDIPARVRQLRSSSRLKQMQALRSLAGLAITGPAARQQAIVASGVAAIVQPGGLSSGGAVQEAAAQALHGLTLPSEAPTLAVFVEAGAVPVLASMLQRSLDSSNAPVAYLAVAALWHLAADDGGAAVAAGGAIPPVVQLLLARRGQLFSQTDVVAVGALLAIAQQKVEQLALGLIEHNGLRLPLVLV